MFMDMMDCFILHTGQHYSYNSDKIFFNGLELPEVKYNLDVGSGYVGLLLANAFVIEKNKSVESALISVLKEFL